jgi:hypothetical protein
MIENDLQLRITLDNIRRFKETLDGLPPDSERPHLHPLLIQAERNGIISMLETLEDEVKNYQAKTGG